MRTFTSLTAVLLIAACNVDGPRSELVSRTDSAGVEVVEYTELDTTEVWRVGAEPILSIGQVEGEEPYLFTLASRIQEFDDGRVLVVENRDAQIRVFNENGRFLGTIGNGRGEGPGEFSWVDWADLIRRDSVLVWDSQLRRISVFSDQGVLGRVSNPTIPEGVALLLGEGAFADGTLLVRPAGRRRDLNPGSIVYDTTTYARWDPIEGDTLTPLLRIPNQNVYLDQEARYWSIPFAAASVVALDSASVVSTAAVGFSFDRHLLDGSHVLRVRVQADPQPIGPDQIRAYQEERIQAAEDPAAQTALRDRFEELPFADHYPAIDGLLVDDLGYVWVRMYDPTDATRRSWHVFDAAGVHRAYVTTPRQLEVHDIQRDKILGRWRDELDVRTVRVYSLDRSSAREDAG